MLIEQIQLNSSLLLLFQAAIALFLVWAAMQIVGGHFKEFLHYLAAEREDHRQGRNTMGTLNWRCVSALTVFGVLTIVALEFEALFGALKKWVGTSQGEELHKVADISNLFFTLVFFAVVSVLAVFLDSKDKRPRR